VLRRNRKKSEVISVPVAEEAGIAYKDISEVVDTMDILGISKKVVRLKPIGNIKE